MKFRIIVSFLFLVYELSFNFIKGQSTKEEDKNDCTKLLNFVKADNKSYNMTECCSEDGIRCQNGYFTYISA